MDGAFDLEVKDDFALMTAYADLTIGFGSLTLLEMDAVGVLQISAAGMAGKMKLPWVPMPSFPSRDWTSLASG